jgi:glutamyl-tRNA(Gln) amidotransferase subunit E
LSTGKLFCRCSTDDRVLDDAAPLATFTRRLRPTQSELGEVDAAARAEAERSKSFQYLGFAGVSCLVDADEEPPHPASDEAVDTALTMTALLSGRVVDEIQWMRKIVIDGSNTSGFQRTGLVSLGGRIDDVGIQALALEEDSARRIGEEDSVVRYGLDRLGIPLIEIATDPDIRDGEHARAIAQKIGGLLRATGRVKRGIGTIRQDLNVSIRDGTRVEIKGVQELNAIPRVIEGEVRRQLRLVEVAKQLKARGVKAEAIWGQPHDLSKALASSASGIIQSTLRAKGVVLGLRLEGFHGLIGAASKDLPRLGRELADYARQEAGVRGLLHGDELPSLGITAAEVETVRKALACGPSDSFLLVAAPLETARRALEVAAARARMALEGVPKEVRQAKPDDSTSYLRPMPGAARMYPETDVPPTLVTQKRLERIRKNLPKPMEERVADLESNQGISHDLAVQIVDEGLEEQLSSWAAAAGDGTLAARTLLATLPEIERTNAGARPSSALVEASLKLVKEGSLAKEGMAPVLEALAKGQAKTPQEAMASLGLEGVDEQALADAARRLVAERIAFVKERGAASVGPLMGPLMQEFRGKVDGQSVSRALKAAVTEALSKGA